MRAIDRQLAADWHEALKTTGMLIETPSFNAELLVHMSDRMFEFVFEAPRTPAEQETIVLTFVDMIATYMEHFATATGREGVSAESFLIALDEAERDRAPDNEDPSEAQIVKIA